jgi:hypothetical protein
MKDWFTSLGTTLISIGFILGVLYIDKGRDGFLWLAVFSFVLGFLSAYLGWRAIRIQDEQEDLKFERLMKEIKGLREDLNQRGE